MKVGDVGGIECIEFINLVGALLLMSWKECVNALIYKTFLMKGLIV